VFYRSDQNILLEKLRLKFLVEISIRIQRYARGSLIRKLIGILRRSLAAGSRLLQANNNDKYDTDKVSEIIVSYKRVMKGLATVTSADVSKLVGQDVIDAFSRYNYQLTLQNEVR
jgi:hypothetical protein